VPSTESLSLLAPCSGLNLNGCMLNTHVPEPQKQYSAAQSVPSCPSVLVRMAALYALSFAYPEVGVTRTGNGILSALFMSHSSRDALLDCYDLHHCKPIGRAPVNLQGRESQTSSRCRDFPALVVVDLTLASGSATASRSRLVAFCDYATQRDTSVALSQARRRNTRSGGGLHSQQSKYTH